MQTRAAQTPSLFRPGQQSFTVFSCFRRQRVTGECLQNKYARLIKQRRRKREREREKRSLHRRVGQTRFRAEGGNEHRSFSRSFSPIVNDGDDDYDDDYDDDGDGDRARGNGSREPKDGERKRTLLVLRPRDTLRVCTLD